MPGPREEDGQSFVEYIAVIALVGIVFGVLAGTMPDIARQLGDVLREVVQKISGA